MPTFFVVDNERDWPLDTPTVEVVAARRYLTDPAFNEVRAAKVFNLCRSYRYQSSGYYVSLLAAARGHKPMPSVATIQDLKSQRIIRLMSEDLDEMIQHSLHPIQSDSHTLSIYFGRALALRYERLSQRLFNLFPAPLMQAQFEREKQRWELRALRPIAASDIPPGHHEVVLEHAARYFARKRPAGARRAVTRYDLAILHDPQEADAPSNPGALKRFERAAEKLGMDVEFIGRDDYGRIAEFDALFIRETTRVNHHTYRFARRAAAEGLVVVDAPDDILKCSNKVYLAELLERHEIPTPRTLVVHKGNLDRVLPELGLPCVLKQPDSSFSQGVVKAETTAQYLEQITKLLEKSDLVIAQEFMPTGFDWRVGIFNRQPLYVCKYYMARRHWQVVKRDPGGRKSEGRDEVLRVEDAPPAVVRLALRAARLIGDGLYGVDLKQVGKRLAVIEINDNPNIDAGVEDKLLKDSLYQRIMQELLERIERGKRQPEERA